MLISELVPIIRDFLIHTPAVAELCQVCYILVMIFISQGCVMVKFLSSSLWKLTADGIVL